jgi:tetratricopeptide (TPR) repeat protein
MKSLFRQWQIIFMIGLLGCTPATKSSTSAAAMDLALSSEARENGNYHSALRYAQTAVSLDPDMKSAHFAVGKLADDLCVPDANPGPDMRMCNLAIEEYKRILQRDADKEAAKDLAFLLWRLGNEESETYYRKTLALDPNDPEALAAIAAMNQSISWRDVAMRKAQAGIPREKPLIRFAECSEIRQTDLARVNEGVAFLMKALQVASRNTDFMIWLSQLYKTRAELQCGDPRAYRADIAEGRRWNKAAYAVKAVSADLSLGRYPPAPPAPLDQ